MVGPPGRSFKYPVPPSTLPVLASISGELKSYFMDGIHGGRCFLITTALHVLLGTDCKARHPPTQHHPSPIWGCLEYSVVEISRQMQISYLADTMVQSYKCHCNFFIFLSCCLQQVQGEKSLFFQCRNSQQHSCEIKFCFSYTFTRQSFPSTSMWTVCGFLIQY